MDDLVATSHPELADIRINVIDVSAEAKIPRKGLGINRSDLLVINNKIDLGPLIGTSVEVMITMRERCVGSDRLSSPN